jgi:hypothetical protein
MTALRCAVLVPDLSPETAEPILRVEWWNGDEAEALRVADEWCRANPGQLASIMVIHRQRIAGVEVKDVK